MSGSKVYVKKPLRRYERAFEEERVVEGEVENSDEGAAPVNPDITSPAGSKGPVMNSKKQPVRYRVKTNPVKKQGEEKSGGEDSGDKVR